jgi:hypothetical protein
MGAETAPKVVMALATGLFFYALSDVLLWQRIFEAHELHVFDVAYQTGHREVLLGMIAAGVVLLWDARWWALWWAAAFYTLAFSGLEDVLYYWLDGRALPAVLPWLNDNRLILLKPVTAGSLLLSATIWIIFWAASLWLLRWIESHLAIAVESGLEGDQAPLDHLRAGGRGTVSRRPVGRPRGRRLTPVFGCLLHHPRHDLGLVAERGPARGRRARWGERER